MESMKRKTYQEIPSSRTFSYILGFILADGYVSKSGLSISLQERDKAFLACIGGFFRLFGYNPKWNSRIIKGRKYHRMQIHSRNLSHFLNEKGIYQRKSLTKTFPEDVPFLDAYIAGYFDGNGSVVLHRGYLELQFHSGSYAFASVMKQRVEELLGKELNRNVKKHSGAWRFALYGEDAVKMGNIFYLPKELRLPRKRERVLGYQKPERSAHFWTEEDIQFVRDTMKEPLQEVATKVGRSYKAVSKRRWLIENET